MFHSLLSRNSTNGNYGDCHANECIMFTRRKHYERAGFFKTADAARPNKTFEEGHTHVCILRGVTRATLIFLLDLLKLLRVWASVRLSLTIRLTHCDWRRRSLDSLSSPASGRDSCDLVFHASASIGKQPLTFSFITKYVWGTDILHQ